MLASLYLNGRGGFGPAGYVEVAHFCGKFENILCK